LQVCCGIADARGMLSAQRVLLADKASDDVVDGRTGRHGTSCVL
jgi:hypothetical protein